MLNNRVSNHLSRRRAKPARARVENRRIPKCDFQYLKKEARVVALASEVPDIVVPRKPMAQILKFK